MNKQGLNLILNTVLAALVMGVFQILLVVFNSGVSLYYKIAPIDFFYENERLVVDNLCVGQTTQNFESERYVYGTKTGYHGEITRELFMQQGEIFRKTPDGYVPLEEKYATVFIEYIGNGINYGVRELSPEVPPGLYKWVWHPSIYVHGVLRTDVPPIESNIFQIKVCQ